MGIEVAFAPDNFGRWEELHALLMRCFASMEGRIDPPSSLLAMNADTLAAKARDETLVLATDGDTLIGCAFLRIEDECLYVGKIAVDAGWQGRGIARRMFALAEDHASANGRSHLELQTRVELTENHETFGRLGFVKTAETAHAGYERPTSITMRKPVVLPVSAGGSTVAPSRELV
ncbi:MAG: GNAT family N-acetyltransferase [Brucellaceae bacterium]|nr:GNAT family N-acetyltransferase [Brucellaceae bacterium]